MKPFAVNASSIVAPVIFPSGFATVMTRMSYLSTAAFTGSALAGAAASDSAL